jgi:hypothetical protein
VYVEVLTGKFDGVSDPSFHFTWADPPLARVTLNEHELDAA